MVNEDRSEQLDHLLDRVQQEEDGLKVVRAQLPPDQEELWSLVVLAHSLEELQPPGPAARFLQTARIRIWNKMRVESRRRSRRTASPSTIRVSWRRALVGSLLALALVFSGLGVASASALPGDPLYNLKRGLEDIQLSLAFSDELQAGLMSRFVDERLEEVEALSQQNRTEDLLWALEEYSDSVDDLIDLTAAHGGDWDGNWSDIQSSLSHHTEVLENVMQQVPENAQNAIQQAIERSHHGQDVMEILEQGGNPSELAPGQQDRILNGSDDPSSYAPGRNKDKDNRPQNRGNQGQGPPDDRGNVPVTPNNTEEEDQDGN